MNKTRIIKFRAWGKINKRMLDETTGICQFTWNGFIGIDDGQGITTFEPENIILMQFTGLEEEE